MCAGHLLCRILIMDTLTYIDVHLVTIIMSYESVDVHAGFYSVCWRATMPQIEQLLTNTCSVPF